MDILFLNADFHNATEHLANHPAILRIWQGDLKCVFLKLTTKKNAEHTPAKFSLHVLRHETRAMKTLLN